MRWAGHFVRMDASKLAKIAKVGKHQGRRKRGGLREEGHEKIGRKKEQKEWLDNTLPDPHPCTAGNK